MPSTKEDTTVDAEWLARQLEDTSARGIAGTVTGLVRSGQLAPGSRLPTVRVLADRLGTSPGTVSGAWRLLARRRILATGRRRGTVVLGIPEALHPRRFESVGNFGSRSSIDLSLAIPDTDLLPELENAMHAGLRTENLHAYTREPITPRLRAALEPRWPFSPEEWVAVNGGYEGILSMCSTHVAPGELVAVEDPTAPRLLDILESADAELLPVACDEHGPLPESLRAAVDAGAVAFIYQPRAHSPRGHSVTQNRSRQLAEVMRDSRLLVIEDDGIGDVASSPVYSLALHLPRQTVLVRSFSKSHGPDLRLAVIAGAKEPIERVRAYRNFGAGWTSRILQDTLAFLLEDRQALEQLDVAREAYAARRERLIEALDGHGLTVDNRDGLSIWVPVHDEKYALVTLAAHGIAVSPGSRYFVRSGPHHVRMATSTLTAGYDHLAEVAALAAGRG